MFLIILFKPYWCHVAALIKLLSLFESASIKLANIIITLSAKIALNYSENIRPPARVATSGPAMKISG